MTSSTSCSRKRRRQNYLLIWVDGNIDETNEDYQNTLMELRSVVNDVIIFTEPRSCIDYLNEIKDETAFIITAGALSQSLVPKIHDMPQLNVIYIICSDIRQYECWAKDWNKIKGVYSDIKPICLALQLAVRQFNQNDMMVSIIGVNQGNFSDSFNKLEPTFMYSQIFKEILLEMEHDQEAVKSLAEFCRQFYGDNTSELKIINEFEHNYHPSLAIRWYTRQCFAFQLLNRGLRTLESDIIVKMGVFMCDVHRQIEELHQKQVSEYHGSSVIVYRGQGLSNDDFSKLQGKIGGLISFNNFLSTSRNEKISLGFAQDSYTRPNTVGILFQITIDLAVSSSPFASIEDVSYFPEEQEILFSMHTVFRISGIQQIKKNRPLYQVDLKLTSDDDQQLRQLADQIRKEVPGDGWYRLGNLMLKVGHFNQAEELYNELLDNTFNDTDRAYIYQQLGWIKEDQGQYDQAVSLYEKSLKISQKIFPSDHPHLATAYSNIGGVYKNMGDYSKALEVYEKSLAIRKLAVPKIHPDLATSYNTIAGVYMNMGDYSKALEFYERSLEIRKVVLPKSHPELAISYNNIGLVYNYMGDYSKALQYHEKSLEIKKTALPPNHPNLANSYNNIGLVYDNMRNYSKAMEYYEKDLKITQMTFPTDHPDVATSYNNIAAIHFKMGEYSKALSYFQKALDIRIKVLLPTHPHIATTKEWIEQVKKRL